MPTRHNRTWRGLPIEYRPERPDRNGKPTALKASEEVARRIVDDLIDHGYGVGDRFPPEAQMLDQYEVSRETLREGLRLLEVQGLISIRRGPGGGPFVAPVNAAYLARSASLYFHVAGATYEELFETWLLLEPSMVGRLARLHRREGIQAALRPFLASGPPPVDDMNSYFDAATNFHGVLSKLNPNRVLVLISQAVEHIATERVVADWDPVVARRTFDEDHANIAKAIIRGHARRAEELAREHIQHVLDRYIDANPSGRSRVVEWH